MASINKLKTSNRTSPGEWIPSGGWAGCNQSQVIALLKNRFQLSIFWHRSRPLTSLVACWPVSSCLCHP